MSAKMSLRKVAVGITIDVGSVHIRLVHPIYWGLLKAIKISRVRAISRF